MSALVPFAFVTLLHAAGASPEDPLLASSVGSASGPRSETPSASTSTVWSALARGGLVTTTPDGRLRTEVDARGSSLRIDRAVGGVEHSSSVRLATQSFGAGTELADLGAGAVALNGGRAVIERPGLTEWYEATDDGVELGWTITAPPLGPSGRQGEPLWLGLAVEGDLIVRISEGRRALSFVDAGAQSRLYARNLHAFDASGKELDARYVVDARGFGIEVDARAAQYPVTVDPLISIDAWTFEVDQNETHCLVANGGDVNGDGFSDLVVSSPAFDISGTNEGRVWVFHGSSNGLPATASWTASGDVTGRRLGGAIATAGDVNGDGFDDLAVGAYGDTSLGVAGAVYVWYGSSTGLGPNGMPANASFVFLEQVAGDFAGQNTSGSSYPDGLAQAWIGTAGDVNGDGFDELLVGATGVDSVHADSGKVYLLFGSGTGLSTAPGARWECPSNLGQANPMFGFSVSTAGDVNGDGFDDFVIGAPYWDGTIVDQGRVHAFYGGSSFATHPTTPDWIRSGPNGEATCGSPIWPRFGFSVSTAGDMNGDGYAEIAVGEEGADCAFGNAGYVHVYFGSQLGISQGVNESLHDRWTYAEDDNTDHGWSVSAAGDVDGDGFADLVAGAIGEDIVGVSLAAGVVMLDLGGPGYSGPDRLHVPTPTFFAVDYGTQAFAYLGDMVTGTGDVDGDGFADVAAVARRYSLGGHTNEGRARLYRGGARAQTVNPGASSLAGAAASDFGAAVQSGGDPDQDGRNDLLIGSPDHANGESGEGRAQLFRSTAAGLFGPSIWEAEGNQVGARFGAAVSGAGDVDNDGDGDVVVGAPGIGNGQVDEGRAYLYLHSGTPAGLATTPAWTFESDVAGAELGSSLAFAGDVNADGFADLIVGAPGYSNGQTGEGRAYLFLGSATGFASTPAWAYESQLALARFGAVVATAGDVNRDGFSDVVVGAPDTQGANPREGRVYVFLGNGTALGLGTTPAWTGDGGVPNGRFGAALALLGDVNRDGFADVAIGAPGVDGLGVLGRALVYLGQGGVSPGLGTVAVTTLTGGLNDLFGAAVAGGDFDGDQFPDLAVGAPHHDGGAVDGGRIAIFVGGSTGVQSTPSLDIAGVTAGGRFGAALNVEADFDGDRRADLCAGEPGSGGGGVGQLYFGGQGGGNTYGSQQRRTSTHRAQDILTGTDSTDQYGLLMSGPNALEPNRPGTPAGRENVHVEFEVRAVGTVFDGMFVQKGPPVDSGHPTFGTPQLAAATVMETAPGQPLQASTGYLWRSRLGTGNPWFPHGRWTGLPGNGHTGRKIGMGVDCNGNGIEDMLEVTQNPVLDCNSNGSPDACDIASGFDPDCDGNGTPNSCETFANDCNGNGIPDNPCEIALPGANCNGNSFLDSCEIAANPALDVNGDGIIDACQFSVYCFGDGTGTVCPCANSGAAGRGCANSVVANGALLTVSGIPSISIDTLVLLGSGMTNSTAIYLQGTVQDNLGLGTALQDGLRCVIGTIVRLGTRQNIGNQSQYPDVGNQPVHIRGAIAVPGTWYYQAFYRNAAATFCPPGTANWSNGVSVVWNL